MISLHRFLIVASLFLSTQAQAAFTISGTASPLNATAGQTVNITPVITSTTNASQYKVGYHIYFGSSRIKYGFVEKLDFTAGVARSIPITWQVPTGAASGNYIIVIAIYDSSWIWKANKDPFATIKVGTTTTVPPPPPVVVSGLKKPGLNPNYFAAPFYQCARNFYISTSGNDANDGSQARPWRNIQRADDSTRRGGDCINVGPGVYPSSNLTLRHGGNAATSNGYVVYRSTSLSGAKISSASNQNGLVTIYADYVVMDGFELDGNNNQAAGACIDSTNASGGSGHHLWITNNLIHHCGLSGIQLNNSEYIYAIHNEVYNNSNTSGWQGSGISIYNPEALANYTRTGTDTIYGNFNIVIANNVVRNNACLTCVPMGSHSDGNGIILDDWRHLQNAPNIAYSGSGLVLGNLVYGNGGKGIHSFFSGNVTIANNTAYGNNWDTGNNATWRAEISVQSGYNNTVVNNIAWTLPGSGVLSYNAPFLGRNSTSANIWENNISYGAANNIGAPDVFSATLNKVNVNPLLVAPASNNFLLQTGSPAIGYGKSMPFLTGTKIDAGSCATGLTKCP